ncbi:uncharacterized protein ACA1_133580 [Acanthamoeba castellanii str. Neff]|uniref:F-box domain-containing protein n=1 Tax=Acanthamoeba castellanii (strain ATCC 30010 / Neff) TaxID=1257118 RepID=L8H3Q6_ACACF|nr:uncharacterized protein ACA1_133580 [Acanthamoeba castellanii str. Neff]ELR19845.1 hypothetical protein ACA1_133580 [Acanthamoeba castellanii str. Neff]
MGGKGSKGKDEAGSGSRGPRLLTELDPGAEVEVVSQLSALALLKQELAQLQAAAEEVQADPSTNKKSKKKKNPSLPASGQQQRLATLSRYIGTWADVARKLEDKVPSAAQQESSHFARMPPELVCEVLSFLDYESLLAFGQTSVWSYGAVHHSSGALVSAKLVDHVHAARGPGLAHLLGPLPLEAPPTAARRIAYSSASSASSLSASVSDVSSGSDDEDGGDAAAAKGGEPQAAETPSRAAIAARLLVVPALRDKGAWLTPRDAEMFEDVFEPRVSQNMKAFASVRTFRIPTALYAFRGGVGAAIAEGLANVEVQLASNRNVCLNSDAWTHRPLRFGPELVPISSIEQFDEMFQSLREVRWRSTELVALNLPSAGDALKAVARLAGSHELLMWKDTQFKARTTFVGSGLGGHRFLVVGGGQATVVQWEYYSNFCGGPYATYSCGMG